MITGVNKRVQTEAAFTAPNIESSKELHGITNTFLFYIRSLQGTIETVKDICGDRSLKNSETPIISEENDIHFQRVVIHFSEQIRDLQNLREQSANLIGMVGYFTLALSLVINSLQNDD